MSRLTLFRSPEFSLVANRALIKRDEVSAVDETVDMLRRVTRLREALDTECDALRARALLAPQVPPLPPRQRVVTSVLAGRLGKTK
jgi:hypothetical protein